MKKILVMAVTGDDYRTSEYALLELDKDTVKSLLQSSQKAQDFAKNEKDLASVRLFDNALHFVKGDVEEAFGIETDNLVAALEETPLIVETALDISSFPAEDEQEDETGVLYVHTDDIYRVVYADGDICWETTEKHASGIVETVLVFKDFLSKLATEYGLA